jgi:hypothetical protein
MDHAMTDDMTAPKHSLANEPDETESLELPPRFIHAERRAEQEQRTAESDKVVVPLAIEELWFEPVDIKSRNESFLANDEKAFEGTIIARRKWGRVKQNWEYLLSGSNGSLLWYSNVKHVSQTSKGEWAKVIKLKAKLDLFKVRDEATMENIVLFEFQTGDPNIDPLYPDTAVWENLTNNVAKGTSTIDSSKNEIKERKSLRSSTKEKGHRSSPNDREESAHLVSAVPGAASTPSVNINSDSNVISQMQMLEAILERAKRRYHWFPWREDEYNFRDDDQYKKAKALGLETLFEMFKTTHDYYLGSMNWSAERGRSPSDIRLRFVRDIDLPSSHPIPNSEGAPTDERQFIR